MKRKCVKKAIKFTLAYSATAQSQTNSKPKQTKKKNKCNLH